MLKQSITSTQSARSASSSIVSGNSRNLISERNELQLSRASSDTLYWYTIFFTETSSTAAFLTLGKSYALFEPSNNLSDIFYDRLNRKICTVRNAGSLGITARGFCKDNVINFRIQATRQINTVSFSPDVKIAGVHRDETSIDFVFLDQKLSDESHPFTNQPCKIKKFCNNYF